MDAVLSGKAADRVPVSVLEGGTWLTRQKGISFKDLYEMDDLGATMIVETFNEMESDTVTTGIGFWLGWLKVFGCPLMMDQPGVAMEISPCIHDLDKDIKALAVDNIRGKLLEDDLIQKMLEQTRRIKSITGDNKLLMCPLISPFSAAAMMIGVNQYMILLAKKSPLLKDLLGYMVDYCAEMANLLCENGCDIIMTCDPVASGDMISQKMYINLVEPTIHELISKTKSCKYLCMHICGNTEQRIPIVKSMKLSGYSIDTAVDMEKALNLVDGTMPVFGNISPVTTLLSGTAEEVYKECCEKISYSNDKKLLILMPGCDLSASIPLENIKAMTKASKDYAKKCL